VARGSLEPCGQGFGSQRDRQRLACLVRGGGVGLRMDYEPPRFEASRLDCRLDFARLGGAAVSERGGGVSGRRWGVPVVARSDTDVPATLADVAHAEDNRDRTRPGGSYNSDRTSVGQPGKRRLRS